MSDPAPAIDDHLIDAWLAGELSDEQAFLVEQSIGAPDDPVAPERTERELLREIMQASNQPEVEQLIGAIQTQHPPDMPAPSEDGWREILTPTDDPEMLGTLGDYEVIELIATGGMGIVLKARDPELDRIAALKALSPELASNATARERFLREARAAAQLEHENILPIYGIHSEAIPWFSMRYAAGGTLQDALDSDQKFAFGELKSIASQAAAALDAAHQAGIIHRDIKPANILFEEDGEKLWVCDFGIARSTEDPSLTYAGAIAGTPQFMSPEQAAGTEIDCRSDLYSLGAVLFRCATGEHLLPGNTRSAVLKNSAGDTAVQLKRLANTKLPKWFQRLLQNLLANDPRDRPHSAAAVVRTIEEEYAPQPKSAQRRRRKRRRLLLAVSTALAALLLLQFPPIQRGANRLIGARFDQAFTISHRLGAYPDLERVISAARDGDSIELPSGKPIVVDNLQIPVGKSLTFKTNAAGSRPVLTSGADGAPGIVSRSPIHVIGIDFELKPRRDSDGILMLIDTSARVERCKFKSRREVENSFNDVKSRAIEMRGSSSVEVISCQFDLEETNAVSMVGGESDSMILRFRDCEITAFFAISGYGFQSAECPVTVEMENSNFAGAMFLKWGGAGSLPEVSAQVHDSVISTRSATGWFPRHSGPEVIRQFHWTGSGNLFPTAGPAVKTGRTSKIYPLSRFTEPASPSAMQTFVEIKASGERFEDLAAAIAAAPSGSTLLLSGEHTCNEMIMPPAGHELHLQAADGASPVIVAADRMDHALFIRGKTSVRGIGFTRPKGTSDSRPIIGFFGGEVRVEDCTFTAKPEADTENSGVGVGFTEVTSAAVRRCRFDMPGGAAILVVDGAGDETVSPVNTHLIVEDGLFICGKAFHRRSRKDTSASITVRRCVVLGETFYDENRLNRFRKLTLSVSDCLIDAGNLIALPPGCSADQVRNLLQWNGVDNFYAPGITTLRPHDDGATPRSESIEELLIAAPSSSDHNGTLTELFDRSKLATPITSSVLREALPDTIQSPAEVVFDLQD